MPNNAYSGRRCGALLLAGLVVAACATVDSTEPVSELTETTQRVIALDGRAVLPDLPVAVSNNAVASVELAAGHYRLYSFSGLLAGRTWRDVTDRAFEYDSKADAWREIDPVPGDVGRLASTAQVVDGQVYLFGGYSVAEDGTEVSTPEVYRFDPLTGGYERVSEMPIPVDDAVSGVHVDRYIYLVSGWHDTDNVANTQVFDTQTGAWLQATEFPGPAVFGHTGGLIDGQLLVCGGVKVVPGSQPGDRRRFVMSPECWNGAIDKVDPARIDWQRVAHHPGPALYRAGSAGRVYNGESQIVLAGGTDNPFNYSGVGYDGVASRPLAQCQLWHVDARRWSQQQCPAMMDQRGLLRAASIALGGMVSTQ